jgi:hypothetical protein
MGTTWTVILAIGSAIIGALAGAYLTNAAARRAEERKAKADQVTRVREACVSLRRVTEQWYTAIADAIDPKQTPGAILNNLYKLYRGGRYEQEIGSYLSVIKTDPSCSDVVNASGIWSKHAYDKKGAVTAGELYMALNMNPSLSRKYPGVEQIEQNPEAGESYLHAVQGELRRHYSHFDAALAAAIDRLAQTEAQFR